MQLQTGITYKARKGKRVLIDIYDPRNAPTPYHGTLVNTIAGQWWYPDGTLFGPGTSAPLDLVEAINDGQ